MMTLWRFNSEVFLIAFCYFFSCQSDRWRLQLSSSVWIHVEFKVCCTHTESKYKRHTAAEEPSVQTVLQECYKNKSVFCNSSSARCLDKENKEPIVLYVHAASVAMELLLSTTNREIMKYLYSFCLVLGR